MQKLQGDWYGKNSHTDWIVKHGCRTLLKKGNRDVLDILGFADAGCVDVDGFALGAASASIGKEMAFSFNIEAKKRPGYGWNMALITSRRTAKETVRYSRYPSSL